MTRVSTFRSGIAARSPMIWIAAAFALGIGGARFQAADERVLLTACAILASAAFFWRRSFGATILILGAFLSLGAFSYISATRAPSPDRLKAIYERGEFISGEPARIEGALARPPEPMPEGVLLRLRAERLLGHGWERRAEGSVRVFAAVRSNEGRRYLDRLALSTGTRIRVTGRLERDERFRNPGVMSNIELLDQQGFDAAVSLKSPLLIERLGEGKGAPVSDRIYGLREVLIREVLATFSASTAGILNASLLGNKLFLDRRTAEVFRQGGTFHVLVISGLHITFIGGLILLAAARFTRNRWLQFFAVSAVLWTYAAAVGGELPVVRASLMFTVLLLGRALYRQNTLLNSLGTGALVLLAWRPEDLFSASFQLTFTSVAAIVVMAFPLIEKARAIGTWMPSAEAPAPPNAGTRLRRFCEMLYWDPALWERETTHQIWSARLFKSPYLEALASKGLNRPLRYIFEGLIVSAAVQLLMLPLVVFYFHRVTPGAIVLNIWVGALLAMESFAAAAALIARQLNASIAAPFVLLTETFNWLLISVPRLLMEIVGTGARPPVYQDSGRWIYFGYLAAVACLAYIFYRWDPFCEKPLRRSSLAVAALAVIGLGAVIVFHPLSAPRPDGRLTVEFLDVGQGDAALVTFPDGRTMLVDAGGRPSMKRNEEATFEPDVPRVGEAVVSEFLWEKGLSRIDLLMPTHADADHMQGMADVLRSFEVGGLLLARSAAADEDFAEMESAARESAVPVQDIARGDHFEIAGVTVEVLHPEASAEDSWPNDRSAVIRLVHGSTRILLTGDIEAGAEAAILDTGEIASDVVKAAHHGSRTSSTRRFVEATGARTVVVPVGRRSMFGHPHPEVVERWKESGAEVLRTGDCGTISAISDGMTVRVVTYVECRPL